MISLKVLIVGSGPSGCYVVDALQRKFTDIAIDIIDRSPHPFGLLRTGVAPDHEKIKNLQTYFTKLLDQPNVQFYGNVNFGHTVTLDDIAPFYHAVFICTGTENDKYHPKLNYCDPTIFGSREIVEWYNGYPRETSNFSPSLLGQNVSLFGFGNVTLDVARILLKSPDELKQTEMPNAFIDQLTVQNITDVHIFIRRGPAQAKCTLHELRELLTLNNINVFSNWQSNSLTATDQQEYDQSAKVKRLVDQLQSFNPHQAGLKNLHLHFYSCLDSYQQHNKKLKLTFVKSTCSGPAFEQKISLTNNTYTHETDSIITCLGNTGQQVDNIPFNQKTLLIPHTKGKIIHASTHTCLLYAAGWIKRGAQGVVGTNKSGALETVTTFLDDTQNNRLKPVPTFNLGSFLTQKNIFFITLNQWKQLNQHELELGKSKGKTRDKVTQLEDINEFLHK